MKTFPIKINFDWLENTGESFETNRTEYIGTYVVLIKGSGVILGKRLFSETTYNKLDLKKETTNFICNIFKTKIRFQNDVYILTDIWSTGPYHFYIDMLSKLVELRDRFDGNIENIKVLVFDDTFTDKVIIPLLRDLGLGKLKILKLKRNEQYIIFGRNYFVTKPHVMGTNNSELIHKIYNLIHFNLVKFREINISNHYKGIYYYRRGLYRRVVNDEEIINKLTGLGFYCTSFEELSYVGAFELMQMTNLFIGIHGGGLTNMMFLQPNSAVIEIKNDNPNPNSHCYWHLARSLKFDYTMFVADTVGESNIVEGKGCNLNVNWNDLFCLIKMHDKASN